VSSRYGSKETSYEDLRAEVQHRLKQELAAKKGSDTSSSEYHTFRKDNLPSHLSLYERAANFAGSVVSISAGKREKALQEQLDVAHLSCSPGSVLSLSVLFPFVVFFVSAVLTVALPLVFQANAFYASGGSLSALPLYYLLFSMVLGVMAYVPLANMPYFLAQRHRQRASNQMVVAVFYIVTFMRHTPNLELALEFAADHIGPPLSFDLKKVLWDVETETYQTVSESLDAYLVQWRDSAREFIEAIHLIQASLYETSNDRRVSSLDKALEVMLDETYEKMLHYAQELKGPITMLHMLGIILPILGLVILPLAVSFFDTHWTIIFSLYNVLLPLGVFYLGKRILVTRPTGYGESETVDRVLTKKASNAALVAAAAGFALFLVGVSPLILHAINPSFDVSFGAFELLGYVEDGSRLVGPFGLGAGLLSLFVTLSLGVGLGWYFVNKVKETIIVRRRTKQLEQEFASALFQLGNRIGNGVPVELAFGRVAEMMEGTAAGVFYQRVATNIQQLGMGVDEAIFDRQHGVLKDFPSNLIESSMKVLVESAKKGPVEASKALMSMSNYIKEMHRVDERLKDLLADVISSMRSQINFLLPTIAGIVIGITSMITTVLGQVRAQSEAFGGVEGAGIQLTEMFGLGIPTYYFQIIVGVYVVQVTLILAYLISGIENGVDPVSEDWVRGRSLLLSTGLYVVIALVVMLLFNTIAGSIITTIN
jgi:Flp pilus assembly protein TadB